MIYYEELLHMIMKGRPANLKICRISWQTGDPGEMMFYFKSEGRKRAYVPVERQSGRRNSLFLGGGSAFLFH